MCLDNICILMPYLMHVDWLINNYHVIKQSCSRLWMTSQWTSLTLYWQMLQNATKWKKKCVVEMIKKLVCQVHETSCTHRRRIVILCRVHLLICLRTAVTIYFTWCFTSDHTRELNDGNCYYYQVWYMYRTSSSYRFKEERL